MDNRGSLPPTPPTQYERAVRCFCKQPQFVSPFQAARRVCLDRLFAKEKGSAYAKPLYHNVSILRLHRPSLPLVNGARSVPKLKVLRLGPGFVFPALAQEDKSKKLLTFGMAEALPGYESNSLAQSANQARR